MKNLIGKTIYFMAICLLFIPFTKAESASGEIIESYDQSGALLLTTVSMDRTESPYDELLELTNVAISKLDGIKQNSVKAAWLTIKRNMPTRFMSKLDIGERVSMYLDFGADNKFDIYFEYGENIFKVSGTTEKTNPYGSFKTIGRLDIDRGGIKRSMTVDVFEKYNGIMIGKYVGIIEEAPTESLALAN